MPEQLNDTKAVKSDDAAIPVHLWDDRIAFLLGTQSLDDAAHQAVNLLHRAQLHWWKHNIHSSWWAWWWENHHNIKRRCPNYWGPCCPLRSKILFLGMGHWLGTILLLALE